MFCRKCGAEIKDGQKFCTRCGTAVILPEPQQQSPAQPKQPAPKQEMSGKGAAKNTTGPLVIVVGVLAALIVILLAVLIVKTQVIDKRDHHTGAWADSDREDDNEDQEDQKDRDDEDDAGKDIEKDASDDKKDDDAAREAEETGDSDAVELLQAKAAEICEQMGDSRGRSFDVKNTQERDYRQIGVVGILIQDISGDSVEDMVVVYGTDNFELTCADIYTVENDSVVSKADGLTMWSGMEADQAAGIVYLKKNGGHWNLVGDTGCCYNHFADGDGGSIVAYDCSGHSYSKVVEDGYAGSDFSDGITGIIRAGRQAGLNIGDGMYLGVPYTYTDQDVRGIAGYTLTIKPDFDFSDFYEYTGKIYGTIRLHEMTDTEYYADSKAVEGFFELCDWGHWVNEDGSWMEADAGSMDYILPDSSSRRLTEEDLWEIEGDAGLLRLARNEIYARHGRMFDAEDLQAYFLSKDWYEPQIAPEDFNDDMLSQVERDNLKLIQEMEKKLKD